MFRQKRTQRVGPLSGIIGILIIVAIMFLLFQMVKGIFSILSFLAPVLLILALILNRKVVFDYGKMIAHKIKTDTPKGLVYAVLSVLGFPLLSGYLFFKAFVTRKWDQIQKDQNKYDEYEEVVSEPVEDDEDFLELPELEIEKPTETNDYDDLFKD
jgi:hypothetical protein